MGERLQPVDVDMTNLANVQIASDNVYFDGLPLPKYIAKQGVSAHMGDDGINTLTVEFIVGAIESKEPDVQHNSPIYDELALRYGYAAPGFDEKWDDAIETLEAACTKRPVYAWIGRDGVTYTDYADEPKVDRIRLALNTLQKMNRALNNLYR